MTDQGLSVKDIARLVRFQQHPTMTACWIWTGTVGASGLGVAFYGGNQHQARRAVYVRYHGEPEGYLRPMCDVKLCVNPHHLVETEGSNSWTKIRRKQA